MAALRSRLAGQRIRFDDADLDAFYNQAWHGLYEQLGFTPLAQTERFMDIFRPAPDSGPRRRFTTSPPARHEITGTPQRPALPPATADDQAGRPETARATAEVGATR